MNSKSVRNFDTSFRGIFLINDRNDRFRGSKPGTAMRSPMILLCPRQGECRPTPPMRPHREVDMSIGVQKWLWGMTFGNICHDRRSGGRGRTRPPATLGPSPGMRPAGISPALSPAGCRSAKHVRSPHRARPCFLPVLEAARAWHFMMIQPGDFAPVFQNNRKFSRPPARVEVWRFVWGSVTPHTVGRARGG